MWVQNQHSQSVRRGWSNWRLDKTYCRSLAYITTPTRRYALFFFIECLKRPQSSQPIISPARDQCSHVASWEINIKLSPSLIHPVPKLRSPLKLIIFEYLFWPIFPKKLSIHSEDVQGRDSSDAWTDVRGNKAKLSCLINKKQKWEESPRCERQYHDMMVPYSYLIRW